MGAHKSKQVTVSYNYSANVALLICMGPVQGLYQVFAGDTLIWPTGKSSADFDPGDRLSCQEAIDGGRSYSTLNTSLGNIRFYWGFGDSAVDWDLAGIPSGGSGIGSPAYRWMCYAVCIDLQFGSSQSPPNLSFVVDRPLDTESLVSQWDWRWRYKTAWTPDCQLADIVASLLTNPIYGAGLDLALLDEASFEAANQDSDAEGSGISPLFDSSSTLKQLLGTLLPYYNAYLYHDQGKVYLTIPRAATGTVPVITPSMLVEEPDLEFGSYFDTWSETRVAYTDRSLQFGANIASYHDAANAAVVGTTVQKGLDRPFLTRQDLAQRTAEEAGRVNGVPTATGRLVVPGLIVNVPGEIMATYPEAMKLDSTTLRASSFVPGQIIALRYPPLNIESMIWRISQVTIGTPEDATVELELTSDASIGGTTALYQPEVATPPVFDRPEAAAITALIGQPTSPQLDGATDGVVIFAGRPNGWVTGYQALANWNTVSDFAPLADTSIFAIGATLNRWRRLDGGSRILVDVTITDALGQAKLSDYKTSLTDFYFVAMLRRQQFNSAVDEHQLIPGWCHRRLGGIFNLVDTNRWQIEVEMGAQSSQPFLLETIRPASDGWWPTVTCWLGAQSDFNFVTSDVLNIFASGGNDPSDTDQDRYFRLPSRTPTDTQEIEDATQIEFKRTDATMHPGGTMVPDWGPACPSREYVTLVCHDGPSAYWRLGDATGMTAFNFIDDTNDGTYSGGATPWGGFSGIALDPVDASASFDGIDGLLDLGNAASVQLDTGSLELLVRCTAPGSGPRALAVKLNAYGLYLFDGVPGWHDWTGATDHIATTAINDGNWHHLVLTWSAGTGNLYVDGTLVLTDALTTIDQLSNLTAAAGDLATDYYAGDLDEIAVYPMELTLSQVQAHANARDGTLW